MCNWVEVVFWTVKYTSARRVSTRLLSPEDAIASAEGAALGTVAAFTTRVATVEPVRLAIVESRDGTVV
jgi:hypothetical protein